MMDTLSRSLSRSFEQAEEQHMANTLRTIFVNGPTASCGTGIPNTPVGFPSLFAAPAPTAGAVQTPPGTNTTLAPVFQLAANATDRETKAIIAQHDLARANVAAGTVAAASSTVAASSALTPGLDQMEFDRLQNNSVGYKKQQMLEQLGTEQKQTRKRSPG